MHGIFMGGLLDSCTYFDGGKFIEAGDLLVVDGEKSYDMGRDEGCCYYD